MKKSIPKPENWQDFESLCKMLWGEIWQIPNDIRKNGRSGQAQAGVDIYGIPKGLDRYWGIQCKGKDDYTKAQLTTDEIDREIAKAKTFKPPLAGYIIATSANKDAAIEEYVRCKNIENRAESFDILLYCWEDIADLIEQYRDIYNCYLNNIHHRSRFDFEVNLYSEEGIEFLEPQFLKKITRSKFVDLSPKELIERHEKIIGELNEVINSLHKPEQPQKLFVDPFQELRSRVNLSWVELRVEMVNIGSAVIEDWKLDLRFEAGVRRIHDRSTYVGMMTIPDLSTMGMIARIEEDEMTVYYRPMDDRLLVQSDIRSFNVPLLIYFDANEITVSWTLLARDFKMNGSSKISVKPKYQEEVEIEEVFDESDLFEDKIRIECIIIPREKNGSESNV
jgi:hypothetical protein